MICNVMSYLAQSCEKYPDRIALADSAASMTYRQVWEHASLAGEAIHTRVRDANRPILVCISHSAADVLTFFSIVFSGNFYVPVDLSLPADRVRSMAETVRPAAVIAPAGTVLPFDPQAPVWTPEELTAGGKTGLEPWRDRKDTDLLYVLFTSGSTGVPKGVAISHRAVIDMAEQFTVVFGFDEHSVFGNQAPFDFDVSVKDIYLALKVGGRLEILEKKLFSFPKLLIDRLNQRQVNTIIWAVPALKIISTLNAFKKERPRYLENVMFSGEVMPPKALDYWRTALPDVRYVNLYGPTEITCNCTYHVIDPAEDLREAIPIGRPFPNCSVFLLDGDEPVREDGRPGEICVTGTCLSPGYYDRPELTAAAFPQNPLNGAFSEPMYRTGDMGSYRDGVLVFLGRKDTQIKHMGHRVELAEIELCANNAGRVEASACVYVEEAARIVLFYRGAAEPEQLLAHLRTSLPRYMLPAELRPVDAFPQTRTGKVDRRKLLDIARGMEN